MTVHLYLHLSHAGTGASCIYPLLGTVMNGWKFLATEIDKDAVRYARENVTRNSLENKIEGQYKWFSVTSEEIGHDFSGMGVKLMRAMGMGNVLFFADSAGLPGYAAVCGECNVITMRNQLSLGVHIVI